MDHIAAQEIADKVAATILRKNRSKSSVALAVGIPATTFTRKIGGHAEFTFSELLRIAEELETSPSDLLPSVFVAKRIAA